MTGYYDIVLGAIPLTLLGVTGSLTIATDFAFTTAVTIAAILSVALIVHAMFVNGPVDLDHGVHEQPSAQNRQGATFQDAD